MAYIHSPDDSPSEYYPPPPGSKSKYWRSCVTILILNLPYFVSVVSVLLFVFIVPDQVRSS